MRLNDRELATVLAALRCFQRIESTLDVKEMDHFESVEPLSAEEIDDLCERINCEPFTDIRPADDPACDKYREAARDAHHSEGEIEIDDNAPVSKGDDDGAYVQAWVWVSNADAGIDR